MGRSVGDGTHNAHYECLADGFIGVVLCACEPAVWDILEAAPLWPQPVSRVTLDEAFGAPFSSGGFAPKEPMNAELVGEVSIDAERHVVQLIEQVWICTPRQLMKDLLQFADGSARNVHGHRDLSARCP